MSHIALPYGMSYLFDEGVVQNGFLDMDIIANALSKICRFNGNTTQFYSVAEHTCHLVNLVSDRAKAWALLHDAPEFVMGDVSGPLKGRIAKHPHDVYRMDYKRAERFIIESFQSFLGWEDEQTMRGVMAEVAMYDYALCYHEAALLQPGSQFLYEPPRVDLGGSAPAHGGMCWTHEVAKQSMINLYQELSFRGEAT